MYLSQKGDYESMRKYAFEFAKEKYFDGYPDTRSVQENLITSFTQDSVDKHIPSKTSRTVSSGPWITSEIRRKIRRRNKTHAKAKMMGYLSIFTWSITLFRVLFGFDVHGVLVWEEKVKMKYLKARWKKMIELVLVRRV